MLTRVDGQPLSAVSADMASGDLDYMMRQFSKKLREFIDLGGVPTLSRAIQARVERSVDLFAACAVAVLCHNDFHEGNVLVDHGPEGWRVNGFVDVENAVAADPLLDLAKTEYYSVRRDDTKLDALLAGYGFAPENLRERLTMYRLYHALELWDWFASIGEHQHPAGIQADMEQLIPPDAAL